jgi:hypothetical protein
MDNAMKESNDSVMDGDDDEPWETWFAQGELMPVPETAPHSEMDGRPSRVGVVVAAISATALTLLIVLAGRV